MPIETVATSGAPRAIGPYSQALRAGGFLFTAGQVGFDPATGELVDGGIAEQTRRVAGVEADARAYLLLRPYLKRSVKVQLIDPADPTPYWLISTRHPAELSAALSAASASTAT